MKTLKLNIIILLTSILLIPSLTNAQEPVKEKEEPAKEKCVSKGNFIIDAYYGFPFLANRFLFEDKYDGIKNTNHIGAKIEYMANKVLGFGLDYTFAKASTTKNSLEYYTKDSILITSSNNYKEQIQKQRMIVRINIHFGTTEKIDPYVSFGTGFNSMKYKNNFPANYPDSKSTSKSRPDFRIAIGTRYFFSKYVGINAEAGFGGPLIQAGVSVKF